MLSLLERGFQVQVMDREYIVDIVAKQCDCRRWNLTGIPCSHAINCSRNERIYPESVVNDCYSTERYLLAYGPKIWPCNDKSIWHKVRGPEVRPSVYEKKVGRPRKNRRKQPQVVEGQHGPKMSKHGTIITCSYCGTQGHNRACCDMRKVEMRPKLQAQRNYLLPPHDFLEEEYGDEDPWISQVKFCTS